MYLRKTEKNKFCLIWNSYMTKMEIPEITYNKSEFIETVNFIFYNSNFRFLNLNDFSSLAETKLAETA